MTLSSLRLIAGVGLTLLTLQSCSGVDDDRLPNYPVNIRLSDTGQWITYGVAGFGSYRRFINSDGVREPRSFPYTENSATGFGGVLLISGMDPFSGATDIPLAYDLACPVECDRNIRVNIDPDDYSAVCPSCGSVYGVTTAAGAPISGPAASPSSPFGLRRYTCISSGNGGYFITN